MSRSREAHRDYMRKYRARKRREAEAQDATLAAPTVSPTKPRKPAPRVGPHRAAVTRMLKSTGLVHVPEEAPLVELLKDLADEMDRNPSPRLTTQYRGALKDLRAVLRYSPGKPQASPDTAPAAQSEQPDQSQSDVAPVSSLASFRSKHGIG